MKIVESSLGCSVIPNKLMVDERGSFTEAYKRSCYPLPTFKQWNVSRSAHNVVRGLHFQTKNPQGKLVRVLSGMVVDVVIDLRVGSKSYGKMEQFCLTPHGISVYVPVGFAHAFWVVSLEDAFLHYGCTEEYDCSSDAGISPVDPDMPYPWKDSNFIFSPKDKSLPKLKEFQSPFRFE